MLSKAATRGGRAWCLLAAALLVLSAMPGCEAR